MYNRLLLLPDLRLLLELDDTAQVAEFCAALHPAVVAEVLEGLDTEEAWRVLDCCEEALQAEVFSFVSLSCQVALV